MHFYGKTIFWLDHKKQTLAIDVVVDVVFIAWHMQEKRKRDSGGEYRPVLRCPRKGVSNFTFCSERKPIFTDINNKLHCNLSLCEILELVFFFVMEISMDTAVSLTGKSSSNRLVMCAKRCVEPLFFIINGARWLEQKKITPFRLTK